MCGFLYFSKFNFNQDLTRWQLRAILACVLAYAMLFSWVLWHPQWILLITPFICLSFLFIRSKRLFFAIEIMGYLGFAAFTMNNWVGNVDNTMLYGGVFGHLLPQTSTLVTDIIGRKSMALSRTFFYLSLYAPFLIFLVETFVAKKFTSSDFTNHEVKKVSDQQVAQTGWLFRTRFLVGCYFVIGLTLACFLPL